MPESIGWEEKLLWGLVCPKCGLDRDLRDLGYDSVKVGQEIRHQCKCGVRIVKIVGKDIGKEAE
jgi:hypothetical protein